MGCAPSTPTDAEAKARMAFAHDGAHHTTLTRLSSAEHNMIESQIKKDRQAVRTEVKMLLLGAGESGKVRPIC